MKVITHHKQLVLEHIYNAQEVEVRECEKEKNKIYVEFFDFDNILYDPLIYNRNDIIKIEFILTSGEVIEKSKLPNKANGFILRTFYINGSIDDFPHELRRASVCDWQLENILHIDISFKNINRCEDLKFLFGKVKKFELWV